jgi:hypothetical protein
MAVAVDMKFRGATLEQYDEVIQKMGFTPGSKAAPASLFHWVAQTDDGLRVVDVWSSKEAFGQFAEEQIGPFTREAGIEEEPEITFYEVHNYLTTP